MASVLCLQAVAANLASPVNPPHTCFAATAEGKEKRGGGDVKQDQSWHLSPLLEFL